MSLSVERDAGPNVYIDVMTGEQANEALRPDEEVVSPYVLQIGGATGGAFAIEGGANDLLAFALRLSKAVQEAIEKTEQ